MDYITLTNVTDLKSTSYYRTFYISLLLKALENRSYTKIEIYTPSVNTVRVVFWCDNVILDVAEKHFTARQFKRFIEANKEESI
jgi:hypothetical protein